MLTEKIREEIKEEEEGYGYEDDPENGGDSVMQ